MGDKSKWAIEYFWHYSGPLFPTKFSGSFATDMNENRVGLDC